MHFDPLFAGVSRKTEKGAALPKKSATLFQRQPAVFFRIPFFKKRGINKKKDISTVNLQAERRIGRTSGKKAFFKIAVSSSKFIVKNDARKNAREEKVQKVLQKPGPPPFREKTKM